MKKPPYIAARRKLFEGIHDRLDCIEPRIRPLVAAMNRRPDLIRTIASCDGHWHRAASRPYVYFHSSPETAKKIQRCLDRWIVVEGRLNFHWTVKGMYRPLGPITELPDLELCFTIESEQLADLRGIERIRAFLLNRKKIDRDLAVLAEGLEAIR